MEEVRRCGEAKGKEKSELSCADQFSSYATGDADSVVPTLGAFPSAQAFHQGEDGMRAEQPAVSLTWKLVAADGFSAVLSSHDFLTVVFFVLLPTKVDVGQ